MFSHLSLILFREASSDLEKNVKMHGLWYNNDGKLHDGFIPCILFMSEQYHMYDKSLSFRLSVPWTK
jgi:hypothetical protein